MNPALPRRVVITGMGAITPLGFNLQTSWKALIENQSGMTTLEEALSHQGLPHQAFEREIEVAQNLPCQVASPVKGVDYDTRTSRFVQFALHAGSEAVEEARLIDFLKFSHESSDRVGVCVGSGMSCVREIVHGLDIIRDKEIRRLSPHFIPKVLTNSAASRLSLKYGLRGPNHAVSTACAAAAHAIGDAMRYIQYGEADIMIAGGTEASINPLSLSGFSRLRALSTNVDVHAASRPFDKARDGFVMGEGAAMLVLEELQHAEARGIPILAELRAIGVSADSYHITSPDPLGSGATRAMQNALQKAGIEPNQVDYINAHATSTPKGDEIEARAIDRTFHHSSRLRVSSTKGATGHLLGAAGAVEAVFTIQTLREKIIPPTRNLEAISECENSFKFQHIMRSSSKVNRSEVSIAMTNSFGFGGTNASLIFSVP